MVPADMARLERLYARLPQLIPVRPPVLLHGALWHDNLHCDGEGNGNCLPALIDAGVLRHCLQPRRAEC
ncbi:phosphotransferase [Xanthomonas graminis]|uniref:phosphotransferase n=1 Tax=Xanthomonas graminis TaxID=3390026 RepID=UPI003075B6E1